jgi:hypothetical protein
MAAPKQSTTESDSQSKYKAEHYADVALHFNKTPDRPQQYQCLASAKARLLFKSGQTLWASLEWHRTFMPATCLAMLFAAPAWIGLKAMMRALSPSVSQHDCRHATFAARGCHPAMMAGMAGVLGVGPSLAALVGLPWTGGVAIGAMALGMVGGMGAAGLVTRTQSALSLGASGRRV